MFGLITSLQRTEIWTNEMKPLPVFESEIILNTKSDVYQWQPVGFDQLLFSECPAILILFVHHPNTPFEITSHIFFFFFDEPTISAVSCLSTTKETEYRPSVSGWDTQGSSFYPRARETLNGLLFIGEGLVCVLASNEEHLGISLRIRCWGHMTKHLHETTWEEDRSQHHNSGTEEGWGDWISHLIRVRVGSINLSH